MRKKRFQVGSVAVLFSVVTLCVAVFALLTVVTAASDARVARQYGDQIQGLYSCENLGQQWLARMDGWLTGQEPLPEGTRISEDFAETEIQDENRTLCIRLRLTQSGYEISRWSCTTQWQPQNNSNLWLGTGEENGK